MCVLCWIGAATNWLYIRLAWHSAGLTSLLCLCLGTVSNLTLAGFQKQGAICNAILSYHPSLGNISPVG